MENKTPVFIGIAAVAIIGVAIFAFSNTSGQNSATSQTDTAVVETQPQDGMAQGGAAGSAPAGQGPAESGMVGEETAEFEDGTYSATGSYVSPAGEETVDVTVTLENGVITATEFTGNATNEKSINYQGMFSEGYQEQVIGKRVDEVVLDKVSGSSLTPKGFNDALDQIRTQAQG